MGKVSWLREALNTMHTPRSGRPFLGLLKCCGAIGSTATETACVLHLTMEELQECIDGKRSISVRQADRLRMYLEVLWWWHCYRSRRPEAKEPSSIKAIYLRVALIWEDLPFRLVEDWQDAHWRHVDTKTEGMLI